MLCDGWIVVMLVVRWDVVLYVGWNSGLLEELFGRDVVRNIVLESWSTP